MFTNLHSAIALLIAKCEAEETFWRLNTAEPNVYFWFSSRCLTNQLARYLAYARPLKSAISQTVDLSLLSHSVWEQERANRSLAPPLWVLPLHRLVPLRHPTSCAVRRPGRGLSTVCPLCVRSTPVVSHRHNCIPRPERKEREERSQVKVFTFHSPNFLQGFEIFSPLCAPRVQQKSGARSRNIVKFGKLWSPFRWLVLRTFTFLELSHCRYPGYYGYYGYCVYYVLFAT